MAYTAQSSLTDFESLSSLHALLVRQDWTISTAVSMLILCVLHWPCATTLLTIKKETHSLKMDSACLSLAYLYRVSPMFSYNLRFSHIFVTC